MERGGGHGRRRTRASAGRQTGEAAEGYGEHMASADVASVASSRNPLLKVSSESKPNSVAGAICNVVRESAGNEPPAVMATGPAAINQAMKSVAIARKYLLDEDVPNQVDLLVLPKFEQDVRDGSNMVFKLMRSEPIAREPAETDLCCKARTDAFKLAGAIAGRVRDGEEVACQCSSRSRPSDWRRTTSRTRASSCALPCSSAISRTRSSTTRRRPTCTWLSSRGMPCCKASPRSSHCD